MLFQVDASDDSEVDFNGGVISFEIPAGIIDPGGSFYITMDGGVATTTGNCPSESVAVTDNGTLAFSTRRESVSLLMFPFYCSGDQCCDDVINDFFNYFVSFNLYILVEFIYWFDMLLWIRRLIINYPMDIDVGPNTLCFLPPHQ